MKAANCRTALLGGGPPVAGRVHLVLILKAADSFSMYFFTNAGAGVTSVNYTRLAPQ